MIGRRQQVALALTAVLAAAAACQNHERQQSRHPAPPGAAARPQAAGAELVPDRYGLAAGHRAGRTSASAERR
ncbi:hypothetical protein ABT288_27345 [Streptomyces sp. NPDC001093]|uniref:hypothetical protein n=1 Tax=Streptomyces sp. NPDC001093 TaxID=3154376 RepID=UPI003330AE5F